MEKRLYIKPQSRIVLLHGSMLMMGGSNTVNGYGEGNINTIGDADDNDAPPTPNSTPARENIWGFTEED
jgi:hypothetical protein